MREGQVLHAEKGEHMKEGGCGQTGEDLGGHLGETSRAETAGRAKV